MSQCVPNWDRSEPPPFALRPSFHPSSAAHGGAPMLQYEMAELTWENGQLAMHGLGQPKVSGKIQNGGGGGDGGGGSKYTWDNKPARASGTLESLVNQGTRHTDRKIIRFDVSTGGGGDDLAPWFADRQTLQTTAGSAATTMDAMVPCHGDMAAAGGASKASVTESSDIPVAAPVEEDEDCRMIHRKRARVGARVGHAERKWSGCRNQISASGSATTFSLESGQKLTLDSRESASVIVGSGGGFTVTTATSEGSLDKTSSGKPCIKTTTTTEDDHDSVCHSTHQVEEEYEGDRKKVNPKSSVSTKRSRAAAIHNQSERKRRDKINEKMKTLQKLVPNANKTDKASMLDEVIEYLKQLQAQVQMMNRMNMPTMMLPMAMQQPLPMASPMAMQQQLQQQLPMASLMAPMGMGMGMGMPGMGMDHLNMLASRSGLVAGMSPLLHPTAFITCDQLQQPSPTPMIADPFSTFLACQSQPMTMEAYNRMAMIFQQLHQHPPMAGGSKN